ncbi:glycosyl hydrolase family 95 catalytic domain-containing protein [Arenibacter sp. P308M17]|uniref:glycosyl hydrolase family 95 catalytic domain-containing protein n=1 Tax=Arenibacter sp. P308M17 TaxID=2303391 RepID=UPI0015F2A36D|nr:hypothetical protein [Arenibacter sp. P308M17]
MPKYEPTFKELAKTWDEAIPLGNATLGALIWQKDGKLRFSLDRADLWDLRPMENLNFEEFDFDWVKKEWENNTYKNVQDKYDAPYDNLPAPSKIPGAAIEFDISSLGEVASVKLMLKNAICEVRWKNGAVLKTFVHATEPIGWYRFENLPTLLRPTISPPTYALKETTGKGDPVTGQDLRRLGYGQGKIEETENSISYDQSGWSGFEYQLHTQWRQTENVLEGSWSMSSRKSKNERHLSAEKIVNVSFSDGMLASMKSHRSWWESFWGKSNISVPDTILQNQWYMEMYKLGSAARQGAPPISLQSVWTADNGKLPPWKGDFHHDLNTQLSYWPTYSGNHLDLEQGFLDWLIKYKPSFKKYTKEFYGTNGLNVPGVTTLTGEPMGGWIQYSFGPTVGAWLGQHFYLHWRYSMDRDFLKEEAYPWIREVAVHIDELSVMGKDGKRKLPLSSSPEIHNNSREAWFDEITNFDLALIKWTYSHAAELAMELGLKEEADKWNSNLNEWPDYAVNEQGLMFSPGLPYNESHRHFSHLMAIHPLGLIDPSHGEKDTEIINRTIANLDATGSSQWVGYSFSWLGNLKARAFDGEGAAKALKDFATSFVLSNGFHVNGDQSGTGKSNFTYRPFTLEGNFAFAAGLQEMLIQSHTGTVRLFPAIPSDWKNVGFSQLRAEGAFLISAQKQEGKLKWVKIFSEKGGELRLKNPFPNKEISFQERTDYTWKGDILLINTKPGEMALIKEKE